MTRICPKCNYVRQPADTAPEWQCPSCHVAYNKVGSSAEASPLHRRSASKEERNSSGMVKGIVVAALIAAASWYGKPLWQTLGAGAVSIGQAPTGEQPAVTLYSTSWCGYCTMTRELFASNGIRFVELDIEKTTDGYEGHKKLGGNGVPLIVVGDDVIHGYNEDRLRSSLSAWMTR